MEGDIYLGAEMSGEGRKAELHMLGESITGRFELEAPHRVGELSTPLEKQQRKKEKRKVERDVLPSQSGMQSQSQSQSQSRG